MNRKSLVGIALIVALFLFTNSEAADKVKLSFDHYYSGKEVVDSLRKLNSAYPNLTSLKSIGKSEERRDIWLLTINNPKTGNDTEKPGIYADGAIHGNEIQATETLLYLGYYLLDKYDNLPIVKKLIDTHAFYIIPIVNVDSRGRFFTDPGGYNIGRTGRVPHDDDRDGLVDEDDYEDLDGDGEILRMRIKDPSGKFKTHPDDKRVMVQVKPGEKGEWSILGSEGIDNDGDGRLNEDPPGYLDMNRNYGFKWQPRYVQSGSGDYPMSGMVTKAISDFVLTKPNIVLGFALHNSGGMILRGPGSKLAGFYPPQDIAVYDFLGKEGEKIIPGYRYLVTKDDLYTTYGDFDEWMYSNLGIYCFTGELFISIREQYRKSGEKKEKPQEREWFGAIKDIEKQKFNEFVNQGSMFKDWTKFKHPQFGEIEIGGWRTFTTRMPPTFMLLEELHRFASLIMFSSRHTPEVEMKTIEIKKIGDGLTRVRVRLTNSKAIPTLSKKALTKEISRKDIVKIEGNGIEVISGGIIDDIHFEKISYVKHRPWMIFTHVPGFGHRDIQWIVKGSGKVEIFYDSLKAENRIFKFDIK
jgi:hypothetical protein